MYASCLASWCTAFGVELFDSPGCRFGISRIAFPPSQRKIFTDRTAVLRDAERRATRDHRCPFGAIVVPERRIKHPTQPHQAAIRSLQNRGFCGKFSFLVWPGEVPNVTLNQRVRGSSPRRRTKNSPSQEIGGKIPRRDPAALKQSSKRVSWRLTRKRLGNRTLA